MCDTLQWPPVASGKLSVLNHALVYVGESQLLDYNPVNGDYRIGQCNRHQYRSTTHLHCDTMNNGVWPEIVGDHALSYVGSNTLLDFSKTTGAYTFWAYNHAVTENSSPIEDKPRAAGSWDSLVGHELTYLDRDLLLTIDPLSGAFNMYRINREVESRDPLEPLSEGKLVVRKKQFVYLGDDALAMMNPTSGAYNIYTCSREAGQAPTVEEDESSPNTGFGSLIFKDSVFPCKLLSAGTLQTSAPCNFTERSDCISQKKCGWCWDNNQCMHGNAEGVCGGRLSKPCTKFDYGFDSVCESYAECATCTSNPACGFCNDETGTQTRGCRKGGLNAPTYGTCSDWMYETCALESCSQFAACDSCANRPSCGWCTEDDGTCVFGDSKGPHFAECKGTYVKNKANCGAVSTAGAFVDLMEAGLVDQSRQ